VDELSTVRVLAVDDSLPWRGFVTAHLGNKSVQVVGTAADGLEAIQKARALQPDIVIMDIWMPKLNGLAATREICRVVPIARVLIATNEADPSVVQAALAAGACGYVLKRMVPLDLLQAVEAVARGKLFIGRGLTGGDDPRHDV
jgi:DNA-binding NarL/FixJ family response regulator